MRDINEEAHVYMQSLTQRYQIQERSFDVSPQMALNLGRAYASNPNLNPELLVALTMGGLDQQALQQVSAIAAHQQARAGAFDPDFLGQNYHFPNGPVGTSITGHLDFLKENQIAEVAERVDETGEGGPNGVLGFLHSGFKGAVRGAMLVAESGWQYAGAMIRGVTDFERTSDVTIGNTSIPNPIAAARNTLLYETGRQLLSGEGVQMGSGYFVEGEVREQQAARQRELLGTVERPDGREQAWTMGGGTLRFLMDRNILPENEALFNVGSGILDAMGSIVFDPLNVAFGAGVFGKAGRGVTGLSQLSSRTGKKVNQLIRDAKLAEESGDIAMATRLNRQAFEMLGMDDVAALSPQDLLLRAQGLDETQAQILGALRDEFGFIAQGGARTVVVPEFVKHFTDARGIKLAQMMSEIDDPKTIFMLHKGKIGPQVVQNLASATTVEDVLRVYARALSQPSSDINNFLGLMPNTGIVNVANAGYSVRNVIAPYSKWFNYMPSGSVLDPTNGHQFINTVIELYNTLPVAAGNVKNLGKLSVAGFRRYNIEARDEIVRRAIRAFADGDEGAIKQLTADIANDFQNMFIQLGYDTETAQLLTTYSSDLGKLNKLSLDDLNSGVPGETPAIMASQAIANGAAVIDPAKLREIVRGSGRVRQTFKINDKYHRIQKELNDLSQEITELNAARQNLDLTDAQRAKFDREAIDATQKYDRLKIESDKLEKTADPLLLRAIAGAKLAGDNFMTQWWKPATLVRAAYVLRIVPEEMARVMMGGVFGQGQFAMGDYFLASLGDINLFNRVGLTKAGRYRADAMARKWQGQATRADELNWQVVDLIAERDVLKAGPVDAATTRKIDDLQRQIDDLTDQIDDILEEAHSMRMFSDAQLSHTDGEALATVTRDLRGPSVNDRRLLLNNTGHTSEAYRAQAVEDPRQMTYWVSGMVDYVNQAANDVHTRAIAQVMRRGRLNKRQKFEMQGVVGTWDEHVAAGRMLDEREGLVAWMQTGGGRESTERLIRMMQAEGEMLDINNFDDVAKLLDRQTKHLATLTGGRVGDVALSPYALGVTPTGARSAWRIVDGGNDNLLEAISTGRFKGREIQFYDRGKKGATVNSDLQAAIREFATDASAPERVLYNTNTIHGREVTSALRDVVGWFFTQAYGIPSDKLARSPSFRRYYWDHMSDLARSASDEAAEAMLANARAAGLPRTLLKKIEDNLSARTPVDGGVDLDVLDELAKGVSLARVRDLLYDASRRGAGLDQFRLITPFGDAWREVFQFWGQQIVRQRGMPLKRLAKSIQGARDSGIMHQNPVTEEFEFTVPFSNKLNNVVEMVPGFGKLPEEFQMGNMVMPAKSMNVLGTFSPGIGPVADYTINTFIPDDPAWDQVRDWFFPIQEPALPSTEAGRANLFQRLIAPSPWMRRVVAEGPDVGPLAALRNFVNDLESDPQFLATRNHVVKSLASSRGFNASAGAENQQKLFDDANAIARRMFFLRGVVAFIGPGAPLPTYIAETKMGNMNAALLTDEWRKLEQELLEAGENPGVASEIILDTYGPDIWLYSASNSSSTIKGAQSSAEWWDWYRQNRDVVDAFPRIGAYFGDTGEFDIDAYGSLFSRGIYKPNTSDELYRQGATDVAYLAYNRLRESFPPEGQRTAEQRQLISAARYGLEQYWGVDLSAATRIAERREQLNELERLVIEGTEATNEVAERLMTTITGQFLVNYMQVRQMARVAAVAEYGGNTPDSWATMRATAPLRDVLRELGREMSAKDPVFARIFQFVLEGEMGDEEDDAEDAGRAAAAGSTRFMPGITRPPRIGSTPRLPGR